jgi:hypothetical protein
MPRTIIPEAVFREYPSKTLRKLTVSGRKMPEIRSPEYCFHETFGKNPDPVGSLAESSTWVIYIEK